MCTSIDRAYQRKEVTGAIKGMRLMGASDEDIVAKVMKLYNVTEEYVLELLASLQA